MIGLQDGLIYLLQHTEVATVGHLISKINFDTFGAH